MKYPKTTLTDREIYDNCPPSGGAPFELIHPRAFQDLRMCIDFGIRHMIEQGRLVVPKTDNEAAFDQLLHNPRELAQQDADAFGIGYVVDGRRVAPHRVQLFVPAAKATGTAGELSESQKIAMQYGQQLNDAEAAAFVSGIELGKELAARQPAPVVLSDDQIEELARKHNLDGSMLNGSRMDDYVLPFARAVIAATNRSQP